MTFTGPFFSRDFLWIKALAALYVIGIVVSHGVLPESWVWHLAVFFSIAMNFSYPYAALVDGKATRLEVAISGILIVMSLLGFWYPLFVIAAIFLHGCWDLAKQCGHGVAFFGWYVSGCVLVDWLYSASLLLYWSYT